MSDQHDLHIDADQWVDGCGICRNEHRRFHGTATSAELCDYCAGSGGSR